MLTLEASVVCHSIVTWSPTGMALGVAEIVAVGAVVEVVGAMLCVAGCLDESSLHPARMLAASNIITEKKAPNLFKRPCICATPCLTQKIDSVGSSLHSDVISFVSSFKKEFTPFHTQATIKQYFRVTSNSS